MKVSFVQKQLYGRINNLDECNNNVGQVRCQESAIILKNLLNAEMEQRRTKERCRKSLRIQIQLKYSKEMQ